MNNIATLRKFWKGKKVFLTGHTGFKGGWFSLLLNLLGAKVTGYSLKPNTKLNLFEEAKLNVKTLDKALKLEPPKVTAGDIDDINNTPNIKNVKNTVTTTNGFDQKKRVQETMTVQALEKKELSNDPNNKNIIPTLYNKRLYDLDSENKYLL